MLKIHDLCKGYGAKLLFDEVSFAMSPGERLGLVGRNGTGKTTFFRMVTEQESPDSGRIEVPRDYSIGYLSQHISFEAATILDEACKGLEVQEGGWVETHRAEATLMGLGFTTEDFHRPPEELSGGFQVRLQLAKVLLSEPNLLLLDEPTNYLDILSVRWLQRFLRNWPNELIIITHDQDFMNRVTTHTVAIHRGKMRRVAGPTTKLYELIAKDEEIQEKTRLNEAKYRKQAERFINRFRAKATKAKQVQSRIKMLEKRDNIDKLEGIDNLDFKFNASPFSGAHLTRLEGMTFGYDPSEPLVAALDLSVDKGDCVGIIGKNGKGKSTLLNLIAGELTPDAGLVKPHPSLKIAHFGQNNIERLHPQMTVEEEVLSVHPDHDRRGARGICGVMMFEGDDALKKVNVLSGGERARVLLGKLLVAPANLLLLDEPSNHLDMESIDSLIEAVATFSGAALVVTHNERVLHALANRLVIFDGGEVKVFEGSYREFLDQVGWADEQDGSGKGGSRASARSRKEQRRLRAEVVAERAKALKPLKRRIEGIETEIVKLEERVTFLNDTLLTAANEGDAANIARFSRELREVQQGIESQFEKLETLTHEHDERAREFEIRLED